VVGGGGRFSPVNIEENHGAKTLLKTEEKKTDDETAALSEMREVFEEISKKVTGSGLREKDRGKWRELADLLVMELEVAAARTNSISNVPAFLTEHLRRRLIGKTKINSIEKTKKGISKSLQVGKPLRDVGTNEINSFEAEPLSQQGREMVLKTMQGYLKKGQQDFVMSFEGTYTPEDWNWLKSELDKIKQT
jgi:hypothetical protein